jgi:hypothetical protein
MLRLQQRDRVQDGPEEPGLCVRERFVVGVPFCFLASRAETVRARFPTITPSTRPGAGATRNFESWRQQDEAEEKFEGERKEAAEANAMSALESKTLDSKIEMDILDALDEIKAYNERHERVDRAELGSAQKPADEMSAKERDEMAAFKRAQAARTVDAKPPPLQGSSSDEAVPAPPPVLAAPDPARPPSPPAPVVLKRRLADAPPPVEKKPKLGGLVAYSSSSEDGSGSS